MDGTEYISQLAEFSNLEQLIALGDDVEEIRDGLQSDPTVTTGETQGQDKST